MQLLHPGVRLGRLVDVGAVAHGFVDIHPALQRRDREEGREGAEHLGHHVTYKASHGGHLKNTGRCPLNRGRLLNNTGGCPQTGGGSSTIQGVAPQNTNHLRILANIRVFLEHKYRTCVFTTLAQHVVEVRGRTQPGVACRNLHINQSIIRNSEEFAYNNIRSK